MAMILTSDHKVEEQSSSIDDDLTDELLVEIFKRLPFKSAFRFKSVSKRWFTLISNPYFTHSFLRYHTNEKLRPREFVFNFYLNEFLVTSQLPEVSFPLSLSFLPCFQTSDQLEEEKAPCIVGSSNGLLLCCATWHYQSIYYVCNPLTKHWVVLPPAPSSPESVLVGFIYCNSASSECSNSFKVVRLSSNLLGEEYWCSLKMETFSSKTGRWTNSVVPCPPASYIIISNETAIDYNGRLHWHIENWQVIIVYHPYEDKVTFIDCPRRFAHLFVEISSHGGILGVSRGRLRMSQLGLSQPNDLNLCLIILELKDYNTGKWCLEHKILINDLIWSDNSLPPNWEPKPPRGHMPFALVFHPYADTVYLGFSECFVSCDLPTKTSKFLGEYPYNLPLNAKRRGFTLVLPPWPTPLPALPHI